MSLGKHVYVQKPLCWSVHEARHLAKKAKDNPKIVTQMGNQRHSADNSRRGIEYVQSGALGEIREVHVWTNRPLGFWPQGIPRPARLTTDPAQLRWDNRGVMQRLSAAMAGANGAYPVPDKLSWDLFLGVAPVVEYHPLYHPFNWRGWVDWGQGALGDMGAHLMDFPVWALNLGLPTVIETETTPFNGVCYPNATTTYFEFPARKGMPPVKLTWYDGGLMPPDPEELENETLDPERRRALRRQEGQAAALQRGREAAAHVEAQLLRRTEGAPRARAARRSRDELGQRDQGHRPDLGAVRLRREAHRDHAARHRLAARELEAALRRARTCASRTTSPPTIS